MCGIIGYIGDKDIDQILLSALSRLEYRGYDSAGIAVVTGETISLRKQTGKLKALKDLVRLNPLEGKLGIGHTRWATHGIPSERNAHPHMDCTGSIAVVHNGIIENHGDLKNELEKAGHKFGSDTDTEVIAHLLEEYITKQNLDLESSVRKVLDRIVGTYAFCVISTKDPEKFVAARNGSPLVIGLGKEENFVASDVTAFLDHTRDAIFLDDYQMAVVSRKGAVITNTRGVPVIQKISRIDWDASAASKEGFDHFMLKEIEEQPKILEHMLRSRLKGTLEIQNLFDGLHFEASDLASVERIILQACGTSWHAALAGKFLLEGIAGIPVEVDVSSEFRYRPLVPQKNSMLVSITQSGETIDTLMGLRRGKQLGYKTLAICNVLGSTIARESDGVIYTHAGPEIGVASTKAYTAQIAVLVLLALYLGKIRGTISREEMEELVQDLNEIPAKMTSLTETKGLIKNIAKKYYESRDFLFLGRGINYPSAHEGALKIKEIAYVHATGHPAGEMKHGPIALIDEKMPVVAIATKSVMYEKMASNIQEVKARLGKVIAIATEGDETIKKLADDVIYIPDTHEFLSPLLVALPLQYLAYYVAVLRGTDVDQPRNLAKSVTVE